MKEKRNKFDSNRFVSQQSSSKGYYCGGCDAYFILPGQKCPDCKKKAIRRRSKPNRNNVW